LKVIGHRGARGCFPENTLEGFRRSIGLGVDGIELDVICSSDYQLLVSHNPFPSEEFTNQKSDLNFFLTHSRQIKRIDVGLKKNSNFPNQVTFKAAIPSLEESLSLIGSLVSGSFELFLEVKYERSVFYPDPKVYADVVFSVLKEISFPGKIIVKSFSSEFMNAFSKCNLENYFLGYLTENVENISEQLGQLSFDPSYISIRHDIINVSIFKVFNNCKVYLWTVNKKSEFERLRQFPIEGIITDLPFLLLDK
jgi:glycerophosphoryl diester phosphodiesterase